MLNVKLVGLCPMLNEVMLIYLNQSHQPIHHCVIRHCGGAAINSTFNIQQSTFKIIILFRFQFTLEIVSHHVGGEVYH